jgi:hypothetical protein
MEGRAEYTGCGRRDYGTRVASEAHQNFTSALVLRHQAAIHHSQPSLNLHHRRDFFPIIPQSLLRSVATLGSTLRAWGNKEFITEVRHRHRIAALCGPHTWRINPQGKEVALGSASFPSSRSTNPRKWWSSRWPGRKTPLSPPP